MHEDIIWQREIKISNDLDNFDPQDKIEFPSYFFNFLEENAYSNKNNNNSASENSISYFKLSDFCCNINIYLKKLMGRNNLLDETDSVTNKNNNNNCIYQPKCECWTVEEYLSQKFQHKSDIIANKKLIKLDEKEKNDLLDIKKFDLNGSKAIKISDIESDSLSNISTSLSKNDSNYEITYFKRRSSEFSLELNEKKQSNLDGVESNLEIERSLPDDEFFSEAINELGIQLSQVSTCFDSFDSQFKKFKI
ncbi:hypothetical protein BpHYR1_046683 [Brachionus plicatilis]|uniref:Uncharacterized protein n=1 Tax=Brachionus plicatilis TaxID=10195 RepID=A0A3M7RVS0_BRAPC|nr:hypothetical protein BpHYR1_046683 [Brachionus plicatilis]